MALADPAEHEVVRLTLPPPISTTPAAMIEYGAKVRAELQARMAGVEYAVDWPASDIPGGLFVVRRRLDPGGWPRIEWPTPD